jgi:hypothetical protein
MIGENSFDDRYLFAATTWETFHFLVKTQGVVVAKSSIARMSRHQGTFLIIQFEFEFDGVHNLN